MPSIKKMTMVSCLVEVESIPVSHHESIVDVPVGGPNEATPESVGVTRELIEFVETVSRDNPRTFADYPFEVGEVSKAGAFSFGSTSEF
jgi:hypothetical protein